MATQKDAIIRVKVEVVKDAAMREPLADAWDEGCREGLLVNNGFEEGALDANPYRSAI